MAVAGRNVLARMTGISIVPSPLLPFDPPSPAEDAKRIVRHGMRDVLLWLGESVGPEPGAPTHAVFAPGNRTMFVSKEFFTLIASGVVGDYVNGEADKS